MRQLQTYTYTIAAFGSLPIPAANDNFIILAATGPVTVRGDTFGTLQSLVAGQGLKMVPFNRLELIDTSGASNTVTILLTPAEFVNQVFSGSVSVVGGVLTDTQLRASPIEVESLPLVSTGSWRDASSMGAGSPLTVFAPGANVNGAIILHAEAYDFNAGNSAQAFIAKSSAPSGVNDGEVVAQSHIIAAFSANFFLGIKREVPLRIAPGLGLYFIASTAGTAGYFRNCRYVLL